MKIEFSGKIMFMILCTFRPSYLGIRIQPTFALVGWILATRPTKRHWTCSWNPPIPHHRQDSGPSWPSHSQRSLLSKAVDELHIYANQTAFIIRPLIPEREWSWMWVKLFVSRPCTKHPQPPSLMLDWDYFEVVWWPRHIGSDIWCQDDFEETSAPSSVPSKWPAAVVCKVPFSGIHIVQNHGKFCILYMVHQDV